MANEAERLEILKMVQSKQISPEDGARLIKALGEERSPTATPRTVAVPSDGGRWFRLAAEEPGGERVNLSIPLGALPMIARFVEQFIPSENRETFRSAQEAITSGFRGDLLRVEQPGGPTVRMWIE